MLQKKYFDESDYTPKLYDVVYIMIYDYLEFIDKITYRRVCRKFKKFKLIDFYHIEQLDLSQNYLVTDLNSLTKLKKLNITGNARIFDQAVKNLNLEILIAQSTLITNLNHMTRLRKLDISFCFNFDKDGINNLNLEILFADCVRNISDINHMTNLKKLYIGRCSGITNEGIKKLNLEELNILYNTQIKNIDHMTKLKKLTVGKALWHVQGYVNPSDVFTSGLITNLKNMPEFKTLKINDFHYSYYPMPQTYIFDNDWIEIHDDSDNNDSDSEFNNCYQNHYSDSEFNNC